MNVEFMLDGLENLFAKQDIQAVEPYLTEKLDEAYKEQDYSACITILNEMIGFFRDTSEYQKSLDYSEQVLKLMKELGYQGTLPYATTSLNVANALRAAGLHKESLAFYNSIFPIYEEHLSPEDERVASLYNNMSLLYQEMGDFDMAVACLNHALATMSKKDDEIKIAITHSNLGASLLKLGRVEEAIDHLEAALNIFNKDEEKDFHYNAAMAAMGQAYVSLEQYEKARECYLIALYEQMKHCGKSEAFYRILDNLHLVENTLGMPLTREPDSLPVKCAPQAPKTAQISGLDLSQEFYECVAKDDLFQQFGAYADRISVGLAGEGSECFGFDDTVSTDHDFGPGFCIWLKRADYEVIGKSLQSWYDTLPTEFKGFQRETVNGSGRVGVWCMEDFFSYFTGFEKASDIPDDHALLAISEENMSCLLNGRIYYDAQGEFDRNRMAFYDAFTDKAWRTKIAYSLIHLGKYGQYNYGRAMKRGDYVTAQITLYKYVEELLKFVHYVNHVFPPYYKWLKKSASQLDKLAVLADLTNALADFADGRKAWEEDNSGSMDKVLGTIEIIAGLIIQELREEGLLEQLDIPEEELFLEVYGKALLADIYANKRTLASLSDRNNLNNNTKEELVEYIVSLEWQAFDEVQNQGGRADCQDDWGTFSIMRKSQYLAWPIDLIIHFIEDFRNANANHWNLITEKYGRMMKTTNPLEYAQIANKLPAISDVQQGIIEQIVEIQVSWMEQFAADYPQMAYNSRSIHTSEDTPVHTSYETYLRGELSTYSHDTLKLYGGFVVDLARKGQNLAKIIMNNTALLYGYDSLDHAEESLRGAL